MTTLIFHKWDNNKFYRIDDMHIKRTGWIIMFGDSPATIHTTHKRAEEFLEELEGKYGMDVVLATIKPIQMPTLLEQFENEVCIYNNIKEEYLQYDPRGSRENKE